MQKRLTRSEVPVELTWKIEDIFATPEDWEKEMAAVAAAVDTVTQFKGKLGEGPKMLLGCLEAHEALQARMMRVMSYASLNQSADATNPANQMAAGKAGALVAQIGPQRRSSSRKRLRFLTALWSGISLKNRGWPSSAARSNG